MTTTLGWPRALTPRPLGCGRRHPAPVVHQTAESRGCLLLADTQRRRRVAKVSAQEIRQRSRLPVARSIEGVSQRSSHGAAPSTRLTLVHGWPTVFKP